jgi:hypothetical protein
VKKSLRKLGSRRDGPRSSRRSRRILRLGGFRVLRGSRLRVLVADCFTRSEFRVRGSGSALEPVSRCNGIHPECHAQIGSTTRQLHVLGARVLCADRDVGILARAVLAVLPRCDLIAMVLLALGVVRSRQGRQLSALGLPVGGWGWLGANGWRATADRLESLAEGRALEFGAAETCCVVCVARLRRSPDCRGPCTPSAASRVDEPRASNSEPEPRTLNSAPNLNSNREARTEKRELRCHNRRDGRAIRDFLVGPDHVLERHDACDEWPRVVVSAIQHRHESRDVAHRVRAAGLTT